MNPRDRIETFFRFYAPDEGGGDGSGTDPGKGDDGAGTGADKKEPTPEERAAAEHQRELDRYRNEAGQAAKKARDLEKKLQELEDAGKTETERLQARAKAADELEPKLASLESQVASLTEALAAEVTRQKAALKELDPGMLDLLPDGDPVMQLAWVSKAVAKATKDRKTALPPGGGRNPGGDRNGKTEPTEEERQKAAQHYAHRF